MSWVLWILFWIGLGCCAVPLIALFEWIDHSHRRGARSLPQVSYYTFLGGYSALGIISMIVAWPFLLIISIASAIYR